MAHFALVNEDNVVVNVVVVDNIHEHRGAEYLNNDCNLPGRWIQTSYWTRKGVHLKNGTPLRKNFAEIGGTYDESRDAFIPVKEFPSWILNEETCAWEHPIVCPDKRKHYLWDESICNWVLMSDRVLDYEQEF